MIQYKITFVDRNVDAACGTGDASIILVDGQPQYTDLPDYDEEPIKQIYIYFSDNDTGEFKLTCDDGPSDDHIRMGSVTTTADSTGNWPSSGGCRWSRVSGNLEFLFTPPEPGRNEATMTWDFEPSTPPVHLKVKIKRQTLANTADDCPNWST